MKNYTESLEDEIKQFKQQKEKVREIIGQIGGKPTFMKKMFNVAFIILVAAAFVLSLITKGDTEVLMIEIIVLLISAKFIYFLFLQTKIIHFQFWILSSIEWRLNEVIKKIDNMPRQ